jgi:ribosomal protein S18 acetylase RimI-like enzyme
MSTILKLSHNQELIPENKFNLILLKAKELDFIEIAAMHAQGFNLHIQQSVETIDCLLNDRDNAKNIVWKLVDLQTMQIIAIASTSINNQKIYLADIVVHPRYSNQGIGLYFIKHLISLVRIVYARDEIYLEMKMTSKVALHIYSKIGFEFEDIYKQQRLKAS